MVFVLVFKVLILMVVIVELMVSMVVGVLVLQVFYMILLTYTNVKDVKKMTMILFSSLLSLAIIKHQNVGVYQISCGQPSPFNRDYMRMY